ncbi:hypothetical protein SAMN04490239_4545 [Rhodococcus koreensis]|uniref:Uncharacterized protein n=1 Tax=Rhodococcus koreensis TaxID=99653 RepID=A0A1H4TIX9_9NOCA|nr:hypothetical protein SAMN04490239_4545 [Rhodococcus koreensis]
MVRATMHHAIAAPNPEKPGGGGKFNDALAAFLWPGSNLPAPGCPSSTWQDSQIPFCPRPFGPAELQGENTSDSGGKRMHSLPSLRMNALR